ncbi:MAG TPA: ribosomal protein S18-alanine N-acetyltransferase [Thermodesulfovibrionales bacterium]|nr:ribosomal protein S18-alanine N-acetyltransferase [Thermodesulfovibrionales bacterium]
MRQIRVREMREEDIPEVIRIERSSFSTPWSETSFLNEIHKSRSIAKVAELHEAVVGYICAEQILDEGHILNLATDPNHRGIGIANTLVGDVVSELRKKACRFLYLDVRASNSIAKGFYEGLGFRVIGVRKKYYVAPHEDGVIMVLEL